MDERAPLGDAFEMLVQAPITSSCLTINDQRVISLSLLGSADVFPDPEPMVVQLPKFLN